MSRLVAKGVEDSSGLHFLPDCRVGITGIAKK
jgi:hypothetical protein